MDFKVEIFLITEVWKNGYNFVNAFFFKKKGVKILKLTWNLEHCKILIFSVALATFYVPYWKTLISINFFLKKVADVWVFYGI